MKKRLISLAISLVLAMSLIPADAAFAQEPGYIEVVPPKYIFASDFSEGLAAVSTGERDGAGFIDKTGKEVIPLQFDGASDFSEGLAAVWRSEKIGFIDKIGSLVIPFTYDFVYPFSDGLALVMIGDSFSMRGDWFFINKSGEKVIQISGQYDNAHSFSDGLAAVWRGGKVGVIDKTGKEIVAPNKYDGIGDPFRPTFGDLGYVDGMALVWVSVSENDRKFGYIDTNGREVVPLIYDWAKDFSDGMAAVGVGIERDEWGYYVKYKYGAIDKTGREVIPLIYEYVGPFSDGVTVTVQGDYYLDPANETYSVIDKIGNTLYTTKGRWILQFSDGLALVRTSTRHYGFINKVGDFVISWGDASYYEGWYDGIYNFHDGAAMFKAGPNHPEYTSGSSAIGYMDKTGKTIVPPKYYYAFDFKEGMGRVEGSNRLYGFVTLTGQSSELDAPSPPGHTDGAHSSLVAELEEALEIGFIPESMIGNWTQPTSRMLAAEMIVMLIETMTGKSIDTVAAEKGFNMADRFSDTNDGAVTFLKASGISNGVDGARYDPSGKFTRAQMVTMLGRMAENVFDMDLSEYQLGTDIFNDLAGFGYAHQYIGWAFETGITLGSGGRNTFNPRGDLQNQHTGAFTLRAYKFFND